MNIVQTVAGFFTPYDYENITIDATAGGKGFTTSKLETSASLAAHDLGRPRLILVTVEAAQMRYRVDGGAPVAATDGHLADPGAILSFANFQAMKNFRAIRETGSSATIRVTYMR